MTKDEQLIESARVFSMAAHASVKQLRKYTGEPYWVHPQAVAEMVKGHVSPVGVAAAFLHDVLEDTGVTSDLVELVFGEEVMRLVVELTDVATSSDGNRAARKAIELRRLSKVSETAKFIKVCDLIDNAKSIKRHDRHFWRVFRREALDLFEVLEPNEAQRKVIKELFR